jgi:hypothetical protein
MIMNVNIFGYAADISLKSIHLLTIVWSFGSVSVHTKYKFERERCESFDSITQANAFRQGKKYFLSIIFSKTEFCILH